MKNEEYLKKLESYEKVPDWYTEIFDFHTGKYVRAPILTTPDGVEYIKLWGNTYFLIRKDDTLGTNTKYGLCRV